MFYKKSNYFMFAFLLVIYVISSLMTATELNISNHSFSLVINVIKSISIFSILFFSYLLNKFRIDGLDLFLISLSLFLIFSSDHYLFTVAFFIITSLALFHALKHVNYNYDIIFIPLFLGIVAIFILYFSGFLDGRILIDEGDYAIGNKESFGFSHPNKASLLLAQLVALSFLFKRRVILTLSLIIYIATFYDLGGRTALGGLIFLILFYFIGWLLSNRGLFLTFVIRWGVVSFLIIYPIIIDVFISQGKFELFGINFDSVMNTRLSLLRNMYLENNGFHFFISKLGSQFTDSGIANFLVGGGVLLYTLFVFFIYKYLKLENDIRFVLLFIFSIVICFVENFINANVISSIIIFSRIIFILKRGSGNGIDINHHAGI